MYKVLFEYHSHFVWKPTNAIMHQTVTRPFPLQWSYKLFCFKGRNSLQAHQNLQETGESFVNSSVKRLVTYWAGGTRGLEENGRWRYNLSFPKFLFHFFWLLSKISATSVWEILRRILVIVQNLQVDKKTCTIKVTLKELRWFQDVCHRWIRQEFHHHCLTIKYSFSNLTISYPAPALVHLNILRTSRDHVYLGYCWWRLAPALAVRQGGTQALVAARVAQGNSLQGAAEGESELCLAVLAQSPAPMCLLVRCLLMLLRGCCLLHREIFIIRERNNTCKYSLGFFPLMLSPSLHWVEKVFK